MTDVAYALTFAIDATETETSIDSPEMVAQLTHELRQPLGTIESIAYYLRMVLPPDDQRTHQQLEKIQELVENMNSTLADALQFLRATPMNPQVLDLHELIGQAIAERPAETRPALQMELADGPLLVHLDAGQCRHLMRSLMGLFRQLGDSPSTLVIRTAVEDGQAVLEFRLPGLTISKDELEKLFRPFGTHLPAGTALCLASARRIVESNGGRISARSETGRGLLLRNAFPAAG